MTDEVLSLIRNIALSLMLFGLAGIFFIRSKPDYRKNEQRKGAFAVCLIITILAALVALSPQHAAELFGLHSQR